MQEVAKEPFEMPNLARKDRVEVGRHAQEDVNERPYAVKLQRHNKATALTLAPRQP